LHAFRKSAWRGQSPRCNSAGRARQS
jgi:hypothetical protein